MAPAPRTVLLAAIIAALAGCGDGPRAPVGAAAPKPDWVANPSLDGQFGAVGIAPRSLGGQQQALDQATASARAELARSLAVTVESSYKDAFTATSDWKSKAPGAEASQLAHELTENVTRQVSQQVLRGSRVRSSYVDAATGETYVWVGIDKASKELGDTVSEKARAALSERGLDGVDVTTRLDADLEKALK
jgi:hypothetical protein